MMRTAAARRHSGPLDDVRDSIARLRNIGVELAQAMDRLLGQDQASVMWLDADWPSDEFPFESRVR